MRVSKDSRSSVPPTSAAKAEGVWHLVARYLDIHAGVSRNPVQAKTDYKIWYGGWEAFWPCFGEQTATGPGSSAYTSRTALLTKRSAVRSTNTWLPSVHDGAVKCGLGVRTQLPRLTQA